MPRKRMRDIFQNVVPLSIPEVQLATARIIRGDSVDFRELAAAISGHILLLEGELRNREGTIVQENQGLSGHYSNLLLGIGDVLVDSQSSGIGGVSVGEIPRISSSSRAVGNSGSSSAYTSEDEDRNCSAERRKLNPNRDCQEGSENRNDVVLSQQNIFMEEQQSDAVYYTYPSEIENTQHFPGASVPEVQDMEAIVMPNSQTQPASIPLTLPNTSEIVIPESPHQDGSSQIAPFGTSDEEDVLIRRSRRRKKTKSIQPDLKFSENASSNLKKTVHSHTVTELSGKAMTRLFSSVRNPAETVLNCDYRVLETLESPVENSWMTTHP